MGWALDALVPDSRSRANLAVPLVLDRLPTAVCSGAVRTAETPFGSTRLRSLSPRVVTLRVRAAPHFLGTDAGRL